MQSEERVTSFPLRRGQLQKGLDQLTWQEEYERYERGNKMVKGCHGFGELDAWYC